MCKHVAAVLYGVGARLDERPELLFRLRAVDETELLSDLETLCQTRGRSAIRRKPWLVTISRHCSVWTWRRVRLRLPRPMRHRPAPERKRTKAWLRTCLLPLLPPKSEKRRPKPPFPLAADLDSYSGNRGPRASQPLFASAASQIIRRAQTGQQRKASAARGRRLTINVTDCRGLLSNRPNGSTSEIVKGRPRGWLQFISSRSSADLRLIRARMFALSSTTADVERHFTNRSSHSLSVETIDSDFTLVVALIQFCLF